MRIELDQSEKAKRKLKQEAIGSVEQKRIHLGLIDQLNIAESKLILAENKIFEL